MAATDMSSLLVATVWIDSVVFLNLIMVTSLWLNDTVKLCHVDEKSIGPRTGSRMMPHVSGTSVYHCLQNSTMYEWFIRYALIH